MFEPFPKMPRLNRDCIITEKIDGTNAQVFIEYWEQPDFAQPELAPEDKPFIVARKDNLVMLAGSRTRYITPGKQSDNAGFAGWVQDNADELFKLGPGRHYGEWWGKGIQRGYGLDHKRFSLFNVERWADAAVRPACCGVVPVLYRGAFTTPAVLYTQDTLARCGSQAAPGFMSPEGIVVWHTAANHGFKVTLVGDEQPKGVIDARRREG